MATQITFSEPVDSAVKLLNTSAIPSVTAYVNTEFEDDNKLDIDHKNDFMTKDSFTDDKKKRLSSIKIWSSNNKGVLEITPDPEI